MKIVKKNLAISALGVLLACPAMAESSANASNPLSAERFSSADIDSNGKLNEQELQPLAAQTGADTEQWLQQYDKDQDYALSQSEYEALAESSSSAEQPGTGERSKIVVNQKPATVNVTKPAAQVTVTQPKPEVTITTRDPEVSVHQPKPEVSVQQAEPQVSVDPAEPTVDIDQAKPQVSVNQAEPDVQVEETNPEVVTRTPASEPQQPSAPVQSQSELDTLELAEVPATNTAPAEETLYEVPLQELRTGDVKKSDGEALGAVEDVVIRNDGGHAGLLVTSDDGDSVLFAPIESLTYQNGDLIINSEAAAEEIGENSRYDISRYQSAPQGARTLQDAIDQNRVSAR